MKYLNECGICPVAPADTNVGSAPFATIRETDGNPLLLFRWPIVTGRFQMENHLTIAVIWRPGEFHLSSRVQCHGIGLTVMLLLLSRSVASCKKKWQNKESGCSRKVKYRHGDDDDDS